MNSQNRSWIGSLSRLGLSALAGPYQWAVSARNGLFNAGIRKPTRLGRPVISVGNLTTGGTGKTPLVIELARRLITMGTRPAVLMRGHRPGPKGSDEALLLAQALGTGVPIAAHPDRVSSARRLLETDPAIGVFLLDDGFQHRQVHRDLDLVLIDATEPFGFGHPLPRGLLRESAANLQRADAVIVTRADQPWKLPDLDQRIEQITRRPPLAHAAHLWDGFHDADGGIHPPDTLNNQSVIGVCGIANPDAFTLTLRSHARQVIRTVVFPDHHAYTPAQIAAVFREAQHAGAQAVVTTDKDWVKWARLPGSIPRTPPVYRPALRVGFLDGSDEVDSLLQRASGGDGP